MAQPPSTSLGFRAAPGAAGSLVTPSLMQHFSIFPLKLFSKIGFIFSLNEEVKSFFFPFTRINSFKQF